MEVTIRKNGSAYKYHEIISVKLKDGTDITDQITVRNIQLPRMELGGRGELPYIAIQCDKFNILTDED